MTATAERPVTTEKIKTNFAEAIAANGSRLPTPFQRDEALFPIANVMTRYTVGIRLRDIVGGVPANPKVMEGWLNTVADKLGGVGGIQSTLLRTLTEVYPAEILTINAISNEDERSTALKDLIAEYSKTQQGCVFKRNGEFPVIEGRIVKSLLKEAAAIAFSPSDRFGTYEKRSGGPSAGKQLRPLVAETVFVLEDDIRLMNADGSPATLEKQTRPIHVTDMRGNPQHSLKMFEIAEGCYAQFTVAMLTKHVEEFERRGLWEAIWSFAQLNGLGADRSQSKGMFEVTCWEKI